MRMALYQALVNKHPGIRYRYHKAHDDTTGFRRFMSYVYLIWLNFAYTILFCHYLDEIPEVEVYESKRLSVGKSESFQWDSPEKVVETLSRYDIISFDVFDTLIYRPFGDPKDIFYLIGAELEYLDFARIRKESETEARKKNHKSRNTWEVSLSEIWDVVSFKTGLDKEKGMALEIAYEKKFCYANPYLKEIYNLLKEKDKKIIFITDMYLPREVIEEILSENGYEGQLFLSCEAGMSKYSGKLYAHVKKELGKEPFYIHVGDNEFSDVKQAKKSGISAYPVKNPNAKSKLFRSHDLSPIIGGAYRGVVNNRLYCGLNKYDKNYEFGLIYGGLFVLGYCHFIHEYCRNHGINRLIFLSRDGEILRKVYTKMYPGEETFYAEISRFAAGKISAGYDKYDFLKKTIAFQTNKDKNIDEILRGLELDELLGKLPKNGMIQKRQLLMTSNKREFINFLDKQWDKILQIYKPQRDAAEIYFREMIKDGDKVALVDIGWAGSSALAIRNLVKNEWKISADVIGILAGTNTCHNAEPYMSESFLLKEQLVSYLYSSSHNREIWKKHDASRNHNLYFELLTSSDSPSLKGYYLSKNKKEVILKYQDTEKNPEGIRQIQQGILDFADDYLKAFGDYPYMLNISGRDAYAPMLVATSDGEKYLKDIYKDFELKVEVGGN